MTGQAPTVSWATGSDEMGRVFCGQCRAKDSKRFPLYRIKWRAAAFERVHVCEVEA